MGTGTRIGRTIWGSQESQRVDGQADAYTPRRLAGCRGELPGRLPTHSPLTAARRLGVAFPPVLQPFSYMPYRIGHMELTTPGVATLRRDLDQTGRDAETADVALAASGDGRAFERLYHTHVARIHSLARRMTGEDHADDLTQDVFVRAWSKLSTFRAEAAFGTWLHRHVPNAASARNVDSLLHEIGRAHV